MALEGERLLAARRIPHLERVVPTSADDPFPVRAEGHASDGLCMASVRFLVLGKPREQIVMLPTAEIPFSSVEIVPRQTSIASVPFALGRGERISINETL